MVKFLDNLANSVGNFFSVDNAYTPDTPLSSPDAIKTSGALSDLGYFGKNGESEFALPNSVKAFQDANGLKVDGIINKGGPTEKALSGALEQKSLNKTKPLEMVNESLPSHVTVSKPATSTPDQKSFTASASFGPKPDPAPKTNPVVKKALTDLAQEKQRPKTVKDALNTIIDHPLYRQEDPAYLAYVQQQFKRAYPGEVQYDETGKMVEPQPTIQPYEVEPFTPNGKLKTQFATQQEPHGQTGRNGAMHEKGSVPKDANSGENIRQGYAASASEFSQEELYPDQEVILDAADYELMEVRDPVNGKLYQVDDYGNYHDEKGVPVSLSDDVMQRLDRQVAEDMQNDRAEKTAQDRPYQEKGAGTKTKDFNTDAFADTLEKRLKPKGEKLGDCAAYVRVALEKAGLDTSGHPRDAKDWGPTLEKIGFTPVDKHNYVPQKGDVVVFQTYPGGHPSGHMAGYNGKNWMSDYAQWDFWGGKGRRKYKPPHVIYRKTR